MSNDAIMTSAVNQLGFAFVKEQGCTDLGAAAVETQHTTGVTKATKEVDFIYMHNDGVILYSRDLEVQNEC